MPQRGITDMVEQLTDAEKARLAHNEYARKWRARNKDKVKKYMAKHWAKVYNESHRAGDDDDR